jgi:hypothetical protein
VHKKWTRERVQRVKTKNYPYLEVDLPLHVLDNCGNIWHQVHRVPMAIAYDGVQKRLQTVSRIHEALRESVAHPQRVDADPDPTSYF